MKTKAQLIVGIGSLIALLAYTLAHTGALLAQYVRPGVIGYVAAFGIELSIVSLSLRIGELRKTKQSATFFYFVLVSVVIVSAVANIAEGFLTLYGEHLTLSNIAKLDVIQAVIGITSTGLISLIVLALSEILGSDVTLTVKQIEKKMTKTMTDNQSVIDNVSSIDKARQAKNDKIADRQERVLSLLTAGKTEDDISKELEVSVRTVQRDIKQLNGRAG